MRKLASVMLCVCLLMLCQGCSVKKMNTEKIRDVEITVLEEEKIPEEFLTQIEEKKSGPFKITYADKDALYIARGYGEQKTSGYSIEVKECYETENAIYIHTNRTVKGRKNCGGKDISVCGSENAIYRQKCGV